MSERHNHEVRFVIVGEAMVKYKLVGGVFKRPHSLNYRQRYSVLDEKGTKETSLETRGLAEARRLQRTVVEEKIIKSRTKSQTIKRAIDDYEAYKKAQRQSTVRRAKAAIFSGCNSHPATSRSSRKQSERRRR